MLVGDLVVYYYILKNGSDNGLTLNKIYKIEHIGSFYFIVKNDYGFDEAYTTSRFIPLKVYREYLIDEVIS